MHLESLEIIGFKSFAIKTVLPFHRGVTAVVGPNGCGKSNVLDAIRWVLGEQSAKALRGGEMADVIFSGTDLRPAHNMAEVSLTFGECERELGVEWNELRITRRVFRDGKSEYLMNGKGCRLKDIHELFMDTGIGRSAYSIMEQGKLDQILSSRPDDRRAIFEEAAGITKFKSQKKEALRKLEQTEANLLRVTDIIKEVKRQIGSLQRQAGKARRYQDIMSELQVIDTHFSYHNYSLLEKKIIELAASIEKNTANRQLQEATIATQEQDGVRLREELVALDLRLEEIRGTAQTLRNRIFSSQSRIETHAERETELRAMILKAQVDSDLFIKRLDEQQQEKEQTEAELEKLLDQLSLEEKALQEGIDRSTGAMKERQEAERASDALTHRLHALENKITDLRGKISLATGRRDAAEQRLEQLHSEQSGVDKALANLTTRLSTSTEAFLKAQGSLALSKEELATAQHLYESSQGERQSAERAWNEVNKQLAERSSRQELLSQLEREGEGLGEGTQALLRGLDRPDFFLPGIVGTLASLLTVSSEDILAVEAALGGASRSVIVTEAQLAQEALTTLKKGAEGRAAILISELFHSPLSLEMMSSQTCLPEGALAWATSLVSAPQEVSLVITTLLEGVAVVEDLETAFRLKRAHPQLAFATRGGEFISRDGVAYGGKDGRISSSALLRRSQITHLEGEIVALKREEERLAVARNHGVEALDHASLRLKEARESLNDQQMMLSSTQGEERLSRRELEETQKRLEMLGKETSTLQEQIRALDEQRHLHERELEVLTEGLTKLREERSLAQHQITTRREIENASTAALSEIRLRVATERERQRTLVERRAPIAARLREFAEAINIRKHDIEEHQAKIKKLAHESEELKLSIVTWKNSLTHTEGEIASFMKKRADSQGEVEAVEKQLRLLRQTLFDLQESRSKEEIELAQLRMRSQGIADHIARRYQVDLTAFTPDHEALLTVVTSQKEKNAANNPPSHQASLGEEAPIEYGREASGKQIPLEVPWERVEVMVTQLTERVDAMGPVNMEAIAEYEELEERYRFLEEQNHDLIHGKKELLEAITRINKTTRELFATTFEQIRFNFQEMFTELFGGGKANLLLIDQSDPLESGIDIIAKPPGKQLQTISLLSGGEKTMTAVALLFAIYMVKPSPFCVLDEMDAPLDESNIGRFIKLLDRFVGQSQFFVITHNKRTMSRADMIYGVTMEEQGVTKLLSVKFHQHTREEEKPGKHLDLLS